MNRQSNDRKLESLRERWAKTELKLQEAFYKAQEAKRKYEKFKSKILEIRTSKLNSAIGSEFLARKGEEN